MRYKRFMVSASKIMGLFFVFLMMACSNGMNGLEAPRNEAVDGPADGKRARMDLYRTRDLKVGTTFEITYWIDDYEPQTVTSVYDDESSYYVFLKEINYKKSIYIETTLPDDFGPPGESVKFNLYWFNSDTGGWHSMGSNNSGENPGDKIYASYS